MTLFLSNISQTSNRENLLPTTLVGFFLRVHARCTQPESLLPVKLGSTNLQVGERTGQRLVFLGDGTRYTALRPGRPHQVSTKGADTTGRAQAVPSCPSPSSAEKATRRCIGLAEKKQQWLEVSLQRAGRL